MNIDICKTCFWRCVCEDAGTIDPESNACDYYARTDVYADADEMRDAVEAGREAFRREFWKYISQYD